MRRPRKSIAESWMWLLPIFGLAFALGLAANVLVGGSDNEGPQETLVPSPRGQSRDAIRDIESSGKAASNPAAAGSLAPIPAVAIVPAGYGTCTTEAGLSVSFPELWLDPRGCPGSQTQPVPLSPDGMARVSIRHVRASADGSPLTHQAFDRWLAGSGLVSLEEVEELEINGLRAVRYDYVTKSSDIEARGLAVLVRVEEEGAEAMAFAAFNAEAPKDEFDRYLPIFEQISRTLRVESHAAYDFDYEHDYGEQCARLGSRL